MKKQLGGETGQYMRYDADGVFQGEVHPEYVTMSRRPGIAKEWFDKYRSDVFPHDFVVHEGKKLRTPKFYDRCLEKIDPFELDYIKDMRIEKATQWADQTSPEALKRKEQFKARQLERLESP